MLRLHPEAATASGGEPSPLMPAAAGPDILRDGATTGFGEARSPWAVATPNRICGARPAG